MKMFSVVICCVFLAGCASTGTSTSVDDGVPEVRITAESVSELFNKKIFFIDKDGNEKRDNYFVLKDDGSAEGTWNSEPLVATWEMRDDYWCRTMVEFHNADSIGGEDCQLWVQQGDVISATRDRGNGPSWTQGIGE